MKKCGTSHFSYRFTDVYFVVGSVLQSSRVQVETWTIFIVGKGLFHISEEKAIGQQTLECKCGIVDSCTKDDTCQLTLCKGSRCQRASVRTHRYENGSVPRQCYYVLRSEALWRCPGLHFSLLFLPLWHCIIIIIWW